jgi:hypothetical protein
MATRVIIVSTSKPAPSSSIGASKKAPAYRRLPLELQQQIVSFDRRTLRELCPRGVRRPSKSAAKPAHVRPLPKVPLAACLPGRRMARMPAELQRQILQFDRRSLLHVVTRCLSTALPIPPRPKPVPSTAAAPKKPNLSAASNPLADMHASIAFAAAARVNGRSASVVSAAQPSKAPTVVRPVAIISVSKPVVASKPVTSKPKIVCSGPACRLPVQLQRQICQFDRRTLRHVATRIAGIPCYSLAAPAAAAAAPTSTLKATCTIRVTKKPVTVANKVAYAAATHTCPSRRLPLELLVQLRTFDRRTLRHVPPRVTYASKAVKTSSAPVASKATARPLPTIPTIQVPAGAARATSALVTVQFQSEAAGGLKPVGQSVSFRIQLPSNGAA